ncbi:pfkB family carbohydrate kinase [Helicosporidium sp. ATCC 50920]|nr:pfkB family carbohydrate kinase [Helicosporidium sp. ATCC 50920]|eukprot:KDD74184.1 pfkB family carbohydrate kinase [Helicosporidium sp. ATCC 50920]
MTNKLVIGIGEAVYDCLAEQRGRSKEDVESWTPCLGGAPANMGAALSRLGGSAAFVGALGDDQRGRDFAATLTDLGVDVEGAQIIAARKTRDVLVTLTEDGERTFAGFGGPNAEFADCFMDAERLPMDKIRSCAVLASGTLELAYPVAAKAIRAAVRAAREAGAGPSELRGRPAVILDVNWRPVFWDREEGLARAEILEFLKLGDILKLSDEEAEWLLGMSADEALSRPEHVLAKLNCPDMKGVLVTAGEKGCSYAFAAPGSKMEITGKLPVFNVKVSDTTGAGDSFLAGFIFEMMRLGGLEALLADPEKIKKAVRFGSATGALTCTRQGGLNSPPDLEEVEACLATSKDK